MHASLRGSFRHVRKGSTDAHGPVFLQPNLCQGHKPVTAFSGVTELIATMGRTMVTTAAIVIDDGKRGHP
jgi:hypothetical protein